MNFLCRNSPVICPKLENSEPFSPSVPPPPPSQMSEYASSMHEVLMTLALGVLSHQHLSCK